MKVILTKDHDQLGITGSTIEVSEGYARNYLIPHSLAVLATKNVQQHFDDRKKAVAKKEAAKLAKAQELGKQIEALTLKLTAKVGTEGKLYGACTIKPNWKSTANTSISATRSVPKVNTPYTSSCTTKSPQL
jgi:large subunit ribosomal protein L9